MSFRAVTNKGSNKAAIEFTKAAAPKGGDVEVTVDASKFASRTPVARLLRQLADRIEESPWPPKVEG